MRELSLLETGYLASLLLASLVLPVLLSALSPSGRARKTSTRIVWVGQLILGASGTTLLLSSTFSIFAAIFGVVVVTLGASALLSLRDTAACTKA